MLTEQQLTAIEDVSDIKKINAVAGSGKTTVLEHMVEKEVGKYIMCMSFNRDIKEEIEMKFYKNDYVKVYTFHGLAHEFFKKNNKYITGFLDRELLSEYDLISLTNDLTEIGLKLDEKTTVGEIKEQWTEFLQSDLGLDDFFKTNKELYKSLFDYKVKNRKAKITHDFYLKVFQLLNISFKWCEMILVDEAQDLNKCNFAIIKNTGIKRLVAVGDSHQQIYKFRGADDALKKVDGKSFNLSYSWRIGEEPAKLAENIINNFKSCGFEIIGKNSQAKIEEYIPDMDQKTVICRSNIGLIREAHKQVNAGKRLYVLGGEEAMCLDLIEEILDCSKNPFVFKDVFTIASVDEAKVAMELTEDRSLKKALKTLEQLKANAKRAVDKIRRNMVSDRRFADVILTTAHKSKGLEFENVELSDDFPSIFKMYSKRNEADFEEEINLIYVALTRSLKRLVLNKNLDEWYKREVKGKC